MNAIALADVVSTLSFGCALGLLLRLPGRLLDTPTKLFLGAALSIYLLVGVSNVLEHTGLTAALDRYEDYIEDLFIPFFLFGLYSLTSRRQLDQRLRAEEELLLSREQYRTLVDNIDLGIALVDSNFTIVMANEARGRLFGRNSFSFTGQKCFRAFRGRDTACADCPGRVAATEGRAIRFDRDATLPDGSSRSLRIHAFPIPLRDGKSQGFIEVVEDRTERVRAAQERHQMEVRLAQHQKLESLAALAGGVAHDFNNLLMGVLGNAEMALRKLPQHSPVVPYVQRIEAAALRASDLTRQMTLYSGTQTPGAEPLDLTELVETSAPLVEAAAGRSVTVHYRLAVPLPTVRGDVDQLRQVLMSLVANASEALSTSAGTIAVATGLIRADQAFLLTTAAPGEDVPEGAYAMLEVTDDGPGIEAAALPRLFDPFYSTKFAGRGLGLPAALGIARAHGGTIRAESEPGLGTRIQVLLPLPEGAATVTAEVRELTATGRARHTILVADDEETVRTVTRMALGELGFEVLTTADGAECLRLLAQHSDGLAAVILDVGVPGLDDPGTVERVREIYPQVPLIFASGRGAHEGARALAQRCAASTLEKPYQRGDLVAAVSRALSLAPAGDRPASAARGRSAAPRDGAD
ncbi:MAG: response regulator [Deltaproteobacteria bacterium]|nr:response regulator [Deltaproteobacteria bacterium]